MAKPIRFNIGYLVDIAAIATMVAFVLWLKTEDKRWLVSSTVSIIIFGLFVLVILFFADTKVTNKSGGTAFIKPETSTQPQELNNESSVYGVDGIKSRGKVYKIVDGTHATITDSGIKVHSFTAKLLNTVMGSVRKPLDSPPAPDWQPLFNSQA